MHLDIPVDPDAPEARQWVQDELSRPEYLAAQPTWFDRMMQQVGDWFAHLFDGASAVPTPIIWLVVVLVVVGLIVVGLLVFGVPRLRRRRAPVVPLFDDGDERDLATLRAAAETAAARGDWALAVEERFRALVRGLVDRDLVRVHPGTTAHGFAGEAAARFPDAASGLADAASAFDAVRYLGRPGDAAWYESVTALDRTIAATRPAQLPGEIVEPVG